MTFLQLCQLTRQECGIQGEGPTAVTNQRGLTKRVVDWVRDADAIVQSVYSDWDFLWKEFTADTTSGSDEIVAPADLGMWDRESFAVDRGTADGRALRAVDFKEWRKQHNVKDNAPPYSITVLPDGNLRLNQPADGTYEIYGNYWHNVTQMTANDDTPPYPDRFHRIVVARAKMFFFEDQEAWNEYKGAEVEYNMWLTELKNFAAPGQQPAGQAEADMGCVVPI